MERLLTGYQENLITLEDLRCRMPELRKQQRANEAELQSLEMTAVDPTRNLRLVETLAEFRSRLCARGNVLEVAERQRVVRLLVQEILVSGENITIRHSIPMPASSPDSNYAIRPSHEPPEPNTGPSYLLRSHGQHARDNVSDAVRFNRLEADFGEICDAAGVARHGRDQFARNTNISSRGVIDSPYDASWLVG
jgi:site-specific DNA recombinase